MSAEQSKSAESLTCPLCKQNNACANVLSTNGEQACWCANPDISFPKGLLEKLPAADRGRACICQACVMAFKTK
ncbi:MAG: cysteine-rich CWC family protein [Colwellia sp.]|nr:cysteine-rich CWC family protein [Colwellia sp.]MCW8865442.1 cysteine-rich CWC family protein [Colwellia sp.]MCW9082003.1 cysteine-rich CWC family protein [Colwellia sp.]